MLKLAMLSILLALPLVLAGCLSPTQSPPTRVVTATPDMIGTVVNSPTLPPLTISVANPPALLPEPPLPPKPCDPPTFSRTRYTATVSYDWDNYAAEVGEEIVYTNTTGVVQDYLVLSVEANRDDGVFSLGQITLEDGRIIENPELESTRLAIPLPGGLGQNCTLLLNLDYRLIIPPIEEGRLGYLGFSARQVNLGHWLPVVALYGSPTDGWYTPSPVLIGEQTTTESSDFHVDLRVMDAPEGIMVAGPGKVEMHRDQHWTFEIEQARDLTISLATGIQMISKTAENDQKTIIELYFFPDSEPTPLSAADHALNVTTQALVLYEELFGVEYPYERFVVIEGDFPDGMEFSGLVFVSEAWFKGWRGESNSWLTVITAHEVAHQWWYSLIGNDPAEYPYLDEAFATYSEYLFFERYYPDQTEWWWRFRVQGYSPEGAVDSNVYRYDAGRPYINAVYLRGAEMLHKLRDELGDEAFFKWMQQYAAQNQFIIASPVELWQELPAAQYAETLPIRQEYFDHWAVLPETTSTP